MMNLEVVRKDFPALAERVFLDSACVGIAAKPTVDAVRGFADLTLALDRFPSHPAMDATREPARQEAARLLNADPDEIAVVESTTHGLNVAAINIELKPQDNVVFCDLEFPQVTIPWMVRQKKIGFEVRVAANRDGRILPEDVAAVVDDRTQAVILSSVQWSNGYKCDLGKMSEIAHAKGAILVVDAVQHAGAVDLDVRETDVDIVTSGGHKWLNAPYGAGFLYVRRSLLDRFQSPFDGYMNTLEPEVGWENYFATPAITPIRDWQFTDTAKKFEIGGTSNYPGAVGLNASLKYVNDLGIANVERHIVEITDYLIEGLQRIGARIVTPLEHEARSGIITFRLSESEAADADLRERLIEAGILISVRYTSNVGGLRVSVHYYNSRDDIAALLDAIKKLTA
jgi:selenocysteine lyase/cysteine desulfurase